MKILASMAQSDGFAFLIAFLPAIPGAMLGWALGGKKRRYPVYVCLLLTLLWLYSLPLCCSLLLQWRSLLLSPGWSRWLEMGGGHTGMLQLTRQSLVLLIYSLASVLALVLAIRPVEQALAAGGRRFVFFAPFLFFILSYGVYLVDFARLPHFHFLRMIPFLHALVKPLQYPSLDIAIGIFALLVWLVYEAGDLWAEGIRRRFRRG
jgi:hypothetical protein